MDKKNLIDEILSFIKIKLAERDINDVIDEESILIGSDSLLDSMNLLELCLHMEDISDENNFHFDWASEEAMSKSRGMFRSPKSLAEEFISQYENSLK